MNLQPLQQSLATYGLYLRGVARLSTEEIGRWGFGNELASPGVALVGNIGSSYWPEFSQSSEYRDGAANPLDRWSRRIAEEIAEMHAIAPLFPFDGPPYYPFLQWAHRAKTVATSPLGLMIHPRYGLWHSYRFGLLYLSVIKPYRPKVSGIELVNLWDYTSKIIPKFDGFIPPLNTSYIIKEQIIGKD